MSAGPFDVLDLAVVLGLVLVGVGCGLIWLPLGLVVPGGLLVVLGVAAAVARGRGGSNGGDIDASV